MTTMASQITSLTVVYSTVYSDADKTKHQSSASLAFVWGIHRDRWIPRTKGQLPENFSIWWRHHVYFFCTEHSSNNKSWAKDFSCDFILRWVSEGWPILKQPPAIVRCRYNAVSFLQSEWYFAAVIAILCVMQWHIVPRYDSTALQI